MKIVFLFFITVVLCSTTVAYAQLSAGFGVSVPDHRLESIAGTGPSVGINYDYKLSVRFKARLSTTYTHFSDVSNQTATFGYVYKMSALPIMAGIKFFPLSSRFLGKVFISGQVGGQFTFYKSYSYSIQESVNYTSRELDFSYSPGIGLDLKGWSLEYTIQYVVNPNHNQLVKSVSYSNVKLSVYILRKYFKEKSE